VSRQQVVQVVLLVVFLAAGLRWLPGEDAGDVLGRGDARLPRYLSARMEGMGDDQVRSNLRGGFVPLSVRRYNGWARVVRQVEASWAEDAVVQLKGVTRNEGWVLRYDLYPRRVLGEPLEYGGSLEDATDPAADVVLLGTDPPRVGWQRR
jgi:hypothetical protein